MGPPVIFLIILIFIAIIAYLSNEADNEKYLKISSKSPIKDESNESSPSLKKDIEADHEEEVTNVEVEPTEENTLKLESINEAFLYANNLQSEGDHDKAANIYLYVLDLINKDDSADSELQGNIFVEKIGDETHFIPLESIYFNLGKALLNLELYDKAKESFANAIAANEDVDAIFHHHLGISKIQLGDFSSCIKDFSNSIEKDSNYFNSYYMRAVAYSSDDSKYRDYKKAIRDLNKYLDFDPQDKAALDLLSKIELITSKSSKAESKITRGEAIFMCIKQFKEKLSIQNTNWSTINSDGTWSVEPNLNRAKKDWYLILYNNKSNKIHLFKVPQNDKVYDKLYTRKDRPVFRLVFDVDDKNFKEKQKNINFKKFHIGSTSSKSSLEEESGDLAVYGTEIYSSIKGSVSGEFIENHENDLQTINNWIESYDQEDSEVSLAELIFLRVQLSLVLKKKIMSIIGDLSNLINNHESFRPNEGELGASLYDKVYNVSMYN